MGNAPGIATAGLLAALLLPGCWTDPAYDDLEEDDAYDYEEEDPPDVREEDDDWFLRWVAALSIIGADDHDSGGDPVPAHVRRADLVRSAIPPDADARGVAAVVRRGRHEGFAVRVVGLAPGAPVELLVGDHFDELVSVAATSADGRGRIRFAMDRLPAGAPSLLELAGRRVQVRDWAGAPLLAGRVPAFRQVVPDLRASRGMRDEGTGVRVRVYLASLPSIGRQVFRLDARGLAPGAVVALRLEGVAGSSVLGVADAAGHVRFIADSRRGEPLPGGAAWIEELAGTTFRLLVDGDIAATGEFPGL